MQLNSEEKIIQLITEIRDTIKKHDRGVRPTVIMLLVLLLALVIISALQLAR